MYGSCVKHTIKIGLAVVQLSILIIARIMLSIRYSTIVVNMILTKKHSWKESSKQYIF